MKKKLLLFIFAALLIKPAAAQVTGSDTVCAGFLYTFNSVVAGADSFVWSYPAGWAVISGSGTAQIQLLCTQNIGQVCVDAYDNGNHLGQFCHNVYWGDGGVGWNVQVTGANMCQCPPALVSVIPNGTGGGCAGCGNGFQSPNIQFAIYDDLWPGGTYMGPADGIYQLPLPLFTTTFYVYQVDLTFGINNAILIEGGLCPATVNNSFTLTGPCMYANLPIYSIPPQFCVGDTILLYTDNSMGNYGPYSWFFFQGNATLFPAASTDSTYCIINGSATIDVNILGHLGPCPYAGDVFLNPQLCSVPIIGDSVVCSGYTYNYNINIPGAVSYYWTIPPGWYGLTGQGTSSISAVCNFNDGDICVEGFDANSTSLGTQCITTQWGNGGASGWDIWPSSFYYCPGQPRDVHFMIFPDTTGFAVCPAGCGNGIQNPNLIYGIYDSSVPYPLFIAEITGGWVTMPNITTTYHVYYVDTTAGSDFPYAVIISGGCGAANINNTVTSDETEQFPPTFIQSPDTVCIGDTVLITQTNPNLSNISWSVLGGTVVSYPGPEQILIIADSAYVELTYDGNDDQHFCYLAGGPYYYIVETKICGNFTISGDTVVCAGYTYNYSVSVPGAVSYNWTLPSGWYGLTGQGTSSISATCNVNDGNICVEAFDINSNSLGTQCITTQWGNGGPGGWDIQPQGVNFCPGSGVTEVFEIQPNGTGSGNCPAGCGNGSLHANLIYGLYDNVYPIGQLLGVVNGSAITLPFLNTNMYVYFVDTTLGSDFPDAIVINGGCGSAVNNNVVTVSVLNTGFPAFIQMPNPACVGDTVLVTQTMNTVYNLNWSSLQGLTIIGNPSPEEVLVVIQSSPATVIYNGGDSFNGCLVVGTYNIDLTCAPPVAAFTAAINPICPGSCTDFTNASQDADSYNWNFPGANPSFSTDTNPSGICYNTPGNYDVQLIATNQSGSDTLLLPGFITVYPYPPAQSIQQNGDTLVGNQGFNSYQWYYNSSIIPGATEYFYVGTQDGDYNLISVDSNGCEVEAVYFGFVTAVIRNEFNAITLSPNPASDIIEIKSYGNKITITSIVIYDMMGKRLITRADVDLANGSAVIDIRTLTCGIYFLEISSGEKMIRRNFIKE